MNNATTVGSDIVEASLQFLRRNGAPVGGLDLMLTSPAAHAEVVVALTGLLLGMVRSGKPAFSRVRLVLPSGLAEGIEELLRAFVARVSTDEADAQARTEILTTSDRGAAALAAAVSDASPDSAVVCAYLDLFSSDHADALRPDAEADNVLGERVRVFREGRWASQELNILAAVLREQAVGMDTKYVLTVSGHGPIHDVAAALGDAYGAIGVIGSSPEPPASLNRLDEWVTALQRNVAVDEVRARIADSVKDGDAGEIEQVLAVALSQAGRPGPAFETLCRVIPPPGSAANPGFLSMCARLALEAGRTDETVALIERVLDDPLATPLALRAVTQTARSANSRPLLLRAATLLHDRVPMDPVGLGALGECWLRAGWDSEVVRLLTPHVGRLDDDGRYVFGLAVYRTGGEEGVAGLQAIVPESMRQRAVADAIWFASTRRTWPVVDEALAVIGPDDGYAAEIVRALCNALELWAVSDPPVTSDDDSLRRASTWFTAAISLLSSHPGEVQGRLYLEDLAGAEGLGEVVALMLLLPLVEDPLTASDGVPLPPLVRGTDEEVSEFLEYFKSFAVDRNAIILIPKLLGYEVTIERAGRLLRGGLSTLDVGAVVARQDDDLEVVLMLLESLLDLSHTAYDIRTPQGAALAVGVTHFTAVGLAVQARYQIARDLVETIMQIAAGVHDSGVHADAWLALADVQIRGHQPRRALVSLALAAQVLPAALPRRARYRALAVRLLRNMDMVDRAHVQLDALREIATESPAAVDLRQLRGLGWSLSLQGAARYRRDSALTADEINRLNDVVRETFEAIEQNQDPREQLVAATHLVEVVRLLREHEVPLPIDAEAIRGRIRTMGAGLADGFEGLLTDLPTLAHVRQAIETSVVSRYGEDVTSDAHIGRLVARRVLAQPSTDVAHRAAALELVSDLEVGFRSPQTGSPKLTRAMTTHAFERAREGGDIKDIADVLGSTRPERFDRLTAVLAGPEMFLERLKECSHGGVLLESDAIVGKHLGHLRVLNGLAWWTAEDFSVFDPHKLGPYGFTYPFAYHEMKGNVFIAEQEVAETLHGLGVSAQPPEVTLRCVASSYDLLAIPANLQLVGDRFAGDVTATCQVPSLGWLADVHAAGPKLVPWEATAWILREDEEALIAPLTIGAEELTQDLTPLGVEVRRNVGLNEAVSSPVLWLVAHGGLGLDSRHFARVSDDRGERYQAGDLIAACGKAELVVLLVCSGGRESHDLWTERVRGLPAELLRRGVRTVVASPWPLDVLVGTRWSTAFASQLLAGEPVSRAAFAASRSLADRHPRDRLAMHVYGDPWLGVVRA